MRQQVLGTLGRFDELKASGRLEALIRSGLRHCQNFAVVDAHTAGETQPVALRRIGPDLVFGRLWQESGLPEAFQARLKTRRYEFDVERAIYLTVLHRLFASGSDRAAERWREDYLIPGAEALELHHLYRAWVFWESPSSLKAKRSWAHLAAIKTSLRKRFSSAAAIFLPKWTWSFSIPLRSTLKDAAQRLLANAVTTKIIGPL